MILLQKINCSVHILPIGPEGTGILELNVITNAINTTLHSKGQLPDFQKTGWVLQNDSTFEFWKDDVGCSISYLAAVSYV